MDNTKRSFTLVELLVVIAIIGILAALMFPGTRSALEMGRKTLCMNNLRQVMFAYHNYADDNNGLLPPFTPDSAVYGTNARFIHLLAPYLEIKNSVYGEANFDNLVFDHTLFPVLTCPSIHSTDSDVSYMQSNMNFGLCPHPNSGWNLYCTRINKISHPAQAILYFEAWIQRVNGETTTAAEPWNCHSIGEPGRSTAYLDCHVIFLFSCNNDYLTGSSFYPGYSQGRTPTWLSKEVLCRH